MKSTFFLRLDVEYAILTVAYTLLVFAGAGLVVCIDGGSSCGSTGFWLVNLLGLFVPIGPNNMMVFSLNFGDTLFSKLLGKIPDTLNTYIALFLTFAPLIVLILALVTIEHFLQKLHLPPIRKVLVNLVILFFVTMAIDFALFHTWQSFAVLSASLGIPEMNIDRSGNESP